MRMKVVTVMFRAIKRSFSEGIKGMMKNGLMTVTSLFVVSACIFVFGVFLMLIFNLNNMTAKMADSYEVNVYIERPNQIADDSINVFIKRLEGTDELVYEESVEKLKQDILTTQNIDVASVEFTPWESLVAEFEGSLGNADKKTYVPVSEGAVSDCIRLKVTDKTLKDETVKELLLLENVERIAESGTVYDEFAAMSNVSSKFADVKYEEIKEALKEDILSIDNVDEKSINFVVGKDIVKEFKENLTDEELEYFAGLPDDFMHDAFNIRLKNLSKTDETIEALQKFENVNSVENTKELVEIIDNLKNSVKKVSIWVIVVFAIVSLFIISNTIKLTVHNRRKEINIMKYVGATDSYIRGPFITEGIMVGFLSAVIAFLISMWSYSGLMSAISSAGSSVAFAIEIMDFKLMWKDLLLAYLGVGVLIGAFGSSISVRRYLHV